MVLMVSVSGIRGIAGTDLVPSVIERYVGAFLSVIQKLEHQNNSNPTTMTIILGRDSRISGPWVYPLVQSIALAMGFNVIPVDIVPTPTVQLLVTEWKANAGIIVTSSHNPVEWNGLKFVGSDGLFISPAVCSKVYSLAQSTQKFQYSTSCGDVLLPPHPADDTHITSLLQLPYIDSEQIKSCHFKVALDSTNGAGGPIMKKFLEQLGCTVYGIFLEPTGIFGRSPEPIPEHLGKLQDLVRKHNCHLGIAVDPDVDRCVFVDENGVPLGEEYTIGLGIDFYLKNVKSSGNICVNLSTSRIVDDLASKYKDVNVFRSQVGEINVAHLMLEKNAIIGGEGNGGLMLPDSHIGRDALVSACLVLQHFANSNSNSKFLTFSQLKGTLPQYQIAKHKMSISSLQNTPDELIGALQNEFESKDPLKYTLNTLDGLRIDSPTYWVHVRKSNTEPIIRVIGEAEKCPWLSTSENDSMTPLEKSNVLCQYFMDKVVSYGSSIDNTSTTQT